MPPTTTNLTAAVEAYLAHLRQIQSSGGATPELSFRTPLDNLLNAVGAALKPKVSPVGEMADQGAGHPDFGLYAAKQSRKGQTPKDQKPECGVVEVKPFGDDAWLTAESGQVSKYWAQYRLVLVTNYRDFVLLGENAEGRPAMLETFRLAVSADEFESRLEHPRAFAKEKGPALGEYLRRALSHRSTIVEPRDLAGLLASYARDGLARVEAAGDTPALGAVRSALEQALDVSFEDERGAAFFRSTLVQTLFYGIFSAWVLWSRQEPPPIGSFNWRESVWHLRVPVLRALFQQISDPGRLRPLGLVKVLDWTAAALDRVDRAAFFERFDEGKAVTYFYEPFLEAFDPDLRKQLGVWYTPAEVVRYMVARVDRALKDDLGIADGLAADNVYVLDPCCGTGAYLAETLRRIAANLEGRGLGALTGAAVKRAATERVFGFEIMPAPFVVAHLQVGLAMQDLDAPLAKDGTERAGVFLTNALTGWESKEPKEQQRFSIPELKEERDLAEEVKQEKPVLVVLGNPPYNGFAGVAIGDEWKLLEAYRKPKQVELGDAKTGDTRGLNDLYVRFFRMAERRIAEKTGRGVVCFISNYSWLDGLSFTGMRKHYLEAFDAIRVDCLNGDKYKTGKIAPDGSPDPSIFSTPEDPVGIQVGTAIGTLVRKSDHAPAKTVGFRNLWGQRKREELTATAETVPNKLYDNVEPSLSLGLPFKPTIVSADWPEWPSLTDLFPTSCPGVHTGRDRFLVDIDLDRLRARIADYFNPALSHEEIARRYPAAMRNSSAFKVSDARKVRESLLARGGPNEAGFVQESYRPFDNRWLYWEADRRLLTAPAPDYWEHVFEGNVWLSSAQHLRKGASEPQACIAKHVGSFHLIERGAAMFPARLYVGVVDPHADQNGRRPNLSDAAREYLERVGAGVEDLFHHVLAVLHDPAYREANAGALRMEWPRIPVPGWPDGGGGAADDLAASAARGRELAQLLDSDTPVPGVTEGALRPEIAAIAVPSTVDGRNMTGDDFALTAGWGHFGQGEAVMPGQGRVVERPYTPEERAALGAALPALGETTFDIHLNDRAYWRNVPAAVWGYKLGGYQVLKKWLSYRERGVLGRALSASEVAHFAETARRVAALLGVTG